MKLAFPVSPDCTVELSHHYGLDRFREFGCVLFDCVNRTYCKKIIVLLPRQKHPYHFHKRKEETFQLLHGDLEVELDGQTHQLAVGDTLLVKPSAWHKFHTPPPAPSSRRCQRPTYNDDSFYEDERIAKFPREKRKNSYPMSRFNLIAAVSLTTCFFYFFPSGAEKMAPLKLTRSLRTFPPVRGGARQTSSSSCLNREKFQAA